MNTSEIKEIQRTIEILKTLVRSPDDTKFLELVNNPLELSGDATRRYRNFLKVALDSKEGAVEKIVSFKDSENSTRIYFARTEEEIENSGKNTYPQEIPRHPIWALTNSSTAEKRDILRRVLLHIGYGKDVAREASEML